MTPVEINYVLTNWTALSPLINIMFLKVTLQLPYSDYIRLDSYDMP